MTLIVEDGSVVEGANSYTSLEVANAYHALRGNAAWTGTDGVKEAALIRATAYIDLRYRGRFPGTRVEGREQSLEWPRTGATDANGIAIADDEIPIEILNAVCEAALRELTEAGSLMPDLERGGEIKSLKAGSIAIEYADGAQVETTFSIIDGILSSLVGVISNESPINGIVERV